ncbi:MAG: hypothetical protein GX827_09270 [Clostridiales bacterium]|jgi:hypothetical protein|nr:hypothetical protein [Clostridiales bacterium]
MKTKILSTLICIAICAAMLSIPFTVNADFGRSYTASLATPTIDGEAEALWDNAEWTDVDRPYDGSAASDYPGAALRMKFLWDEKNFYFFAEVTDSDVNFDNDIVEIYLDELNCRVGAFDTCDSQTRFYKDGAVVSASGTNCKENSTAVGKDTDAGWVIEGAMPWTEAQKEGNVLGFELMYNIGDSNADFAQAFRWNVDTANGDPAPWQDTTAFGTLTLGAPIVVAVEEEAPAAEEPAAVEEPATEAAAETADAAEEAPVADAAPAAAETAAQTGDTAALAILAAAAVFATAVLVKKH